MTVRSFWLCVGLAGALVAGGLIWRTRSAPNEEAARLLKRAREAESQAAANTKTVGTIEVKGRTSSGEEVTAQFGALGDTSGRVRGYTPRLGQRLKEGETADLALPNGGKIVVSAPAGGQSAPTTELK